MLNNEAERQANRTNEKKLFHEVSESCSWDEYKYQFERMGRVKGIRIDTEDYSTFKG